MDYTYFWKGLNHIDVSTDGYVSGDIIKISNIKDHLFVLTSSHNVYHGNIEKTNDHFKLRLIKSDIHANDITCNSEYLYVVECNGTVVKISEDLQQREEITFKIEAITCPHGYREYGRRVKIKHISVSDFGCLFVTENGQLWALGDMPQIGISSTVEPRRVTFFNGRFVYDAVMGHDFAAALVRKYAQISFENQDSDTDECSEDVFLSSCPKCTSTGSSSVSQQSLPEICPLGLSVKKFSDDTSSISNPSQKSTSSLTDSPDSSNKLLCYSSENSKNLEQVEKPEENDNKTDTSDTEECDEKKNIIFRNTEAAREFLTRQFSWMSVGEEYLAECTEGPTRIIKQNVSNVASLVYEGVKTVGDKVVTLSRHVSGGSSDTNDVLETFEEIYPDDFKQIMSNLNTSGKFDDFPWSSSTGTSEKDLSDRGILGRSTFIIKTGSMLLNTEVWTWGNSDYGQLGLGDMIKRNKPTQVSKLCSIGVQKLVCGNFHCAALTLDGRVFIWGRNNNRQVFVETTSNQSSPKQILPCLNNDRFRDVACGDLHTLLYTHNSILYFMGKHLDGSTEKLMTLKISKEIENNETGKNEQNKGTMMSKILSSGMISCASRAKTKEKTKEYLVLEQQFLEHTNLVNSTIVKQFQKKSDSIISVEMNIYETLCRCYSEILHFTAANVLSLIEFVEGHINENEIIMFRNVEEHISTYKNYLNAICDVIALGGFAHIAKLVDIPQHVHTIFAEFLPSKKAKRSADMLLSFIFQFPLTRVNMYKTMLTQLTGDKNAELLAKWKTFSEEQEKRRREADLTKHFWESSGKVVELLRSPERRLIRESRSHPISYFNSGRFSSHWFVLLTDVFIHLNGTSQTVHELPTIWVEPLQDTENLRNALLLILPEDSFTLYTTTPQYKTEWLQAFQSAIKMRLKKMNALQPPPALRTATYIFQKHPVYKDAKYTGRWYNGKLHGSGKLEWPDGKVYCGQFQNNALNGYGRIDLPNIGVYEGQVKDNLQNGSGIMKYVSGDIYEGQFKDGLPHGHGIMKQGHFMSNAASIYIGEWVCGVKQGYGVMDYISSGEKYLGNWHDNKKHDCGLIVTLDGIYYEGVFSQDSLTGHGLMIFEDGTHYEGEFRAAGILNGKGVLTLRSGDKIEGSLNGAWNEGIKITNATLHMKIANTSTTQNSKPISFGKLCVSPNQKWKAIFKHYYQIFNVSENTENSPNVTQKIWQNVAVHISNSKQNGHTQRHNVNVSCSGVKDTSVDHLDTIPQFGCENLTKESFDEVKQYLQKAFDCIHHPLGSLLSELTTAYTATYGGVRVHPLLLSHAVAELHSIISRIYEMVCLLFPALPSLDKEIIFNEEDDVECEIVNATALLHPILLPRVHSALFILYTLHHKNEDDAYWKRLLKWNKQPDHTLMAFLGIDQKFWTTKLPNIQEITSPLREQMYVKAIDNLQQLKTTFSPLEKLFVLRQTFQKITAAIREELGRAFFWTMDELFPVFHFVVVRARILQLGSEIHFIEDFMEPYLQLGELGIMFTILKACYYQILQEKVNITS